MELTANEYYLARNDNEGAFIIRYIGPEPGSPLLIKVEIIDPMQSDIQHEPGYTIALVKRKYAFLPWTLQPEKI